MIRHFYSDNNQYDWTRIKGRGFVKTFSADEIPEGMWDPGELTGTHCRIDHDGKIYKIIAVEKFMIMISPTEPYNKSFSLMVADPRIPFEVIKELPATISLKDMIEEVLSFQQEIDEAITPGMVRIDTDERGTPVMKLQGSRWLTDDELLALRDGMFE